MLYAAKGLIYAPEHGIVAFTVPGMAAFIGWQIDGGDSDRLISGGRFAATAHQA